MTADFRGPEFDSFWQAFSDRLRAFGRKLCGDCDLPLSLDWDDLTHKAVITALDVVSARLTGRTVTLALLEQVKEDVLRQARVSLLNDFRDEVRRIRRQQKLLGRQTQLSTEAEGSSGITRSRVDTPEDIAIAQSLSRQMADASKSQKNKSIATAAGTLALTAGDAVSGKDLTALTGLKSSDLADFRKMIAVQLDIHPAVPPDEVKNHV